MFGKPQKALHLYLDEEKKKPKHLGISYAVMEKFDGWYMYVDYINGRWGKIKSRANRIIPSLEHIDWFNEAGTTLKPKENMRVIFEGIIPNMEFRELNGIFNRKTAVTHDLIFKVHDVIDNSNFEFNLRYKIAREFVENLNHPCVELVEILTVSSNKERWNDFYEEIISRGGEGVILKEAFGKYQPDKRNHSLMKIKCELTLDLEVVGLVPGEGKYLNTLGALKVREKDGTIHTVSGMSDSERNGFWNNPDSILGRVVEVKAMARISNGSLREPRFKAVRFDKSVEEID